MLIVLFTVFVIVFNELSGRIIIFVNTGPGYNEWCCPWC